MKDIRIVRLGSVDSEVLRSISRGIEKVFALRATAGSEIPLPESAYDAERTQYRSAGVLGALRPLRESDQEAVLGVTEADLYVPKLNFVFGEADVLSGVTVISLARLRQEFYGLPPGKTLFHARAVKEAIHELGHIFCLDHCPNPSCVMYFSHGIQDTDRKGPGFCRVCKDILGI